MGSTGKEMADDMTESLSISYLQRPAIVLQNGDLEQLPSTQVPQGFREAVYRYSAQNPCQDCGPITVRGTNAAVVGCLTQCARGILILSCHIFILSPELNPSVPQFYPDQDTPNTADRAHQPHHSLDIIYNIDSRFPYNIQSISLWLMNEVIRHI